MDFYWNRKIKFEKRKKPISKTYRRERKREKGSAYYIEEREKKNWTLEKRREGPWRARIAGKRR
jgi:hypothetical protein